MAEMPSLPCLGESSWTLADSITAEEQVSAPQTYGQEGDTNTGKVLCNEDSVYAYKDIVAALVRWRSEEKAVVTGISPNSHQIESTVEEFLFRRAACLHSVVAQLDMAAKRQVLSLMRRQPHTHDAFLPKIGLTIGQVCSFQLLSKGVPVYAPGEHAHTRARQIFDSIENRS